MSVAARPHVCVVIANHNYGRWLMGAIRSAVQDDWPNKSVWVWDDGSTDGSLELVLGHLTGSRVLDDLVCGQLADWPVDVLVGGGKSPQGPAAARNQILRRALPRADYLAILDADDEFLPGKLTRSLEVFAKYPHVWGVYSDYDVLAEDGHITREYKVPYSRRQLFSDCHIHSACVLRKELFEKVGLYDETFRVCEDYALWCLASAQGMFHHIPECLMRVRTGLHNSTHSVKQEIWVESWKRIQEKIQRGEYGA